MQGTTANAVIVDTPVRRKVSNTPHPLGNRAFRRALASKNRKRGSMVDKINDALYDEDSQSIKQLHPTKGFRRMSMRRIEAISSVPVYATSWSMLAHNLFG